MIGSIGLEHAAQDANVANLTGPASAIGTAGGIGTAMMFAPAGAESVSGRLAAVANAATTKFGAQVTKYTTQISELQGQLAAHSAAVGADAASGAARVSSVGTML